MLLEVRREQMVIHVGPIHGCGSEVDRSVCNRPNNGRWPQNSPLSAYGIVVCLLFASGAWAQDTGMGWDADDSLPPPTSHQIVLQRPTTVQPFHLLVYQDCPGDSGGRQLSGQRTRLDIMSAYGFAKFDAWSTDTSMQLTVRLRAPVDTGLPVENAESLRGKRRAQFRIPGTDFALSVILGRDTARLRVTQAGGLDVQYLKKSKLLILDSVRQVPDDMVCLQLHSRIPAETRKWLDLVNERFGKDAIPTMLSPGYYRCTPALWIKRVGIGRRRAVNETTLGHLLCFRVRDAYRRSELEAWLHNQQRLSLTRDTQND